MHLVPDRLVAGGDALARDATGKVVFVTGALPGEEVEARLVQQRRDFSRAVVQRVVVASPDRVDPPCPHLARGCGGCSWQHLAPRAQHAARVELVRDALRRIARLREPEVSAGPPAHLDDLAARRTTLRAAVDRDGRLGLRASRSHRVVPLDSCLVAHPALEDLLARVRLPGASEAVLRCSVATGERLLHWEGPPRPEAAAVPDGVRTGAGAWLTEQVAGARLRVGAGSFFQPSPHAAEVLVSTVRALLGGDRPGDTRLADAHLVDAYGGVGLFACTIGREMASALLVEGNPAACDDARLNLAAHLPEGRWQVLGQPVEEGWVPGDGRCVVVADPARSGLGPRAADVLAGLTPEALVLVSCDAAALARDAALLADRGYGHAGSVVLDHFPHTHHVEVVTRFVPGGQA